MTGSADPGVISSWLGEPHLTYRGDIVLHRTAPLGAALLATALVLAGCGSGAEDDAAAAAPSGSSAGAFPVTIEHTFGTTTIDEEPQDVVTWGFGSTDAADRKSTRLNSSHANISYAVFCLKKK